MYDKLYDYPLFVYVYVANLITILNRKIKEINLHSHIALKK